MKPDGLLIRKLVRYYRGNLKTVKSEYTKEAERQYCRGFAEGILTAMETMQEGTKADKAAYYGFMKMVKGADEAEANINARRRATEAAAIASTKTTG